MAASPNATSLSSEQSDSSLGSPSNGISWPCGWRHNKTNFSLETSTFLATTTIIIIRIAKCQPTGLSSDTRQLAWPTLARVRPRSTNPHFPAHHHQDNHHKPGVFDHLQVTSIISCEGHAKVNLIWPAPFSRRCCRLNLQAWTYPTTSCVRHDSLPPSLASSF